MLLPISSEDKPQDAYHILSEIDVAEKKFGVIRIGRIEALEKRHAFFQVAQKRQAHMPQLVFQKRFYNFCRV